MLSKKCLAALVVCTTVLFSWFNLSSRNYSLAALAFAAGLVWLWLEIKEQRFLTSFFFVAFIGLAIPGAFNQSALPFMILGLSIDLAAWDLSRFLARISLVSKNDDRTRLERRHLRMLFITIGVGLMLAWPALAIRIPMSFVVVLGVALTLILILRKSFLDLRL